MSLQHTSRIVVILYVIRIFPIDYLAICVSAESFDWNINAQIESSAPLSIPYI